MTPRLLLSPLIEAGQRLALDREQAHHVIRVLRLRDGDPIQLFDGSGSRWAAQLSISGRADACVTLLQREPPIAGSPLRLCLVQAISAAERMDFSIEKAVELGVASIQPVASDRSVVRLDDERARKRLAHWQRLVIAASAQCGRDHLPVVHEPMPLSRWLAERDPQCLGWVLDPGASESLIQAARGERPGAADLLVGPESGLSADELAAARLAGLRPVLLGPRVLRTETAGPAAIAVLIVCPW